MTTATTTTTEEVQPGPMRIASFLPSATEMIFSLGLGEYVVGEYSYWMVVWVFGVMMVVMMLMMMMMMMMEGKEEMSDGNYDDDGNHADDDGDGNKM